MSKCRFCSLPEMKKETLAVMLADLEPQAAGEKIRAAAICPEAQLELGRRVIRFLAGPQDWLTQTSAPTLH